ncbi:MAG: Lrp/AsnC family transcriptional regulator [Magnetococcales bacterium]|nr:Lrp/AsnC family transcriptional regulator [Magnetococcales bacterium]
MKKREAGEIDDLDRKILAILQEDGRIANADLAKKVKLSPPACHARLKKLRETTVIQKTVALLDQEVIGCSLTVFVEVSLQSQQAEALHKFEKAVRNSPVIQECYLMSGKTDYLLRIATWDMADFEEIHREILSKLPGVSDLRSGFTIRTISKKTSLPLKRRKFKPSAQTTYYAELGPWQ